MKRTVFLGAALFLSITAAMPASAGAHSNNDDSKDGASAIAAVIALADDGPVDHASLSRQARMAMDVSSYAASTYFAGLTGDEFKDAQVALRFMMVAKQKALAASCDGFSIDSARYTSVLNRLMAPFEGLVKKGQNNLVVDRLMFGYGTLFGGELALAAYDPVGFCANGTELRNAFSKNAVENKFLVLVPTK